MAGGFQTKNHFQFRRINGSENAQASIRSFYAHPLFTAIANFGKQIFHGLVADSQSSSRDPQLHPVRRLHSNERRKTLSGERRRSEISTGALASLVIRDS